LMSTKVSLQTCGCRTFTATSSPDARSRARCTCATVPLATACGAGCDAVNERKIRFMTNSRRSQSGKQWANG